MSTTPGGDGEAVTGLEPDPAVLEAVDTQASSEVMHLLAEGVPLTLLADLASPGGPASPAILEDEGLPEVAWWEDEHADHAHHAASADSTDRDDNQA